MSLESRGPVERARLMLFLATGLAVPFFAFPVARLAGRPVDAASLLAGAFVAASIPGWFRRPARTPGTVFLSAAVVVPLLVLFPPRPEGFSASAFAVSFAHWVLVVLFFVSTMTLAPGEAGSRLLVRCHVAAGALVAAFAIYQLIGIPHGCPATGAMLGSFQREPFRFTPIGATYAGGGYMRPTSVFLEPAWMGGFLAWTVALALLAPKAKTRADRVLRLGAGLVAAAAIAASVSWGAYVDLLVVLAAAAASFAGRMPARRAIVLGAAAAAVLVVALATPPGRRVAAAVGERLTLLRKTASAPLPSTATADTPRVRWENAQQSWRLFVSHAPRGIGLGQFGRHVWETPGGGTFAESLSRRDPWVGWIEIAAEAGMLGPLLLAAAIGIVVFRARAAGAWRPVAIALAALAAVQQLHTASYIDLWWWFPLALGAVLAVSHRRRPEGGAPA